MSVFRLSKKRSAAAVPLEAIESEVVAKYEEHAAALLRYASVFTGDRETARDALQEAFLRYFILRCEGREVFPVKPWLFRVVRNYLLDCLKAARSKNHVTLEEIPNAEERRKDPEAAYARTELLERLLAVLTCREIECLRLRAEGMQYDEIAEVLGVRSGTVGAMLAHCQKKLQRERQRMDDERNGQEIPHAPKQAYAP
jgi:RNA polymerase sigma-70 factor (ECF subfamily)